MSSPSTLNESKQQSQDWDPEDGTAELKPRGPDSLSHRSGGHLFLPVLDHSLSASARSIWASSGGPPLTPSQLTRCMGGADALHFSTKPTQLTSS